MESLQISKPECDCGCDNDILKKALGKMNDDIDERKKQGIKKSIIFIKPRNKKKAILKK